MFKLFNRASAAVASCLIAATVGLSGSAVASAGLVVPEIRDDIAPPTGPVELNQGDKIQTYLFGTDQRQECTLGYIDPDASFAYTAGHCLFAESDSTVYNSAGVPVGRVAFADRTVVGSDEQRDYLHIDLFNGVHGENKFSGNTVLGSKGVRAGDTVCRYGAGSAAIDCGSVAQVTGNIVRVSDMDTIPGDSGGPVWVPGKGFAGVIAGNETLSSYSAFALSSSAPTKKKHYALFDTVV